MDSLLHGSPLIFGYKIKLAELASHIDCCSKLKSPETRVAIYRITRKKVVERIVRIGSVATTARESFINESAHFDDTPRDTLIENHYSLLPSFVQG